VSSRRRLDRHAGRGRLSPQDGDAVVKTAMRLTSPACWGTD